ncbi:Cytochrome c oxidase subunit 2 [Sphingomonas antarctica]|uniref:cytochrome c oxidase subunit II n=1 Tax=Sphingomonas antarctica TaxID=2040274 RepID=UPI0039E7BA5E
MKLFAPLLIALGLGLSAPVLAQPAPAPVVAEQQAAAATANAAAPVATPAVAAPVLPKTEAGIGQPTPGAIGIQKQVTVNGERALWMHNALLMPIITVISFFVLGLLFWVAIFHNRRSNPVASKTSHHTGLEIAWTLIPVLILVAIAIPSISLLAAQYKPAGKDALTIKAIGNQWYWSYEYPDNGGFEVVANMLPDDKAKAAGKPRLLGTDNPIVIPIGTTIRLLTTANDVIHSWAVPAFWTKMDAVPGRTNETTFKVDRIGTYYGQCSELCGARHGFMPIEVSVVSKADFDQWVLSKGGKISNGSAASAAKAANAEAGGGGQALQAPATASGTVPTATAPDNATVPAKTTGTAPANAATANH